MDSVITENEKNHPELKELHRIAVDENEPDYRRWQASFCYTMIVLALNRDRQEVSK